MSLHALSCNRLVLIASVYVSNDSTSTAQMMTFLLGDLVLINRSRSVWYPINTVSFEVKRGKVSQMQ